MPIAPLYDDRVATPLPARTYTELDVRPGGRDFFVRPFTLAGVRVRVEMQWMERVGRWSALLRTATDAIASQPQLVVGGGRLRFDARRADLPSGRLEWAGADDYGREELGTRIRLLFSANPGDPGFDAVALMDVVLSAGGI